MIRILLSLLLVLTLASCSKDDDSSTSGNTNVKGTMTAKINGTDWSATYLLTGSYTSNLLAITADQISGGRDKKIQFNLAGVTGPGTYSFGGFTPNSGTYIDIPEGTTDPQKIIDGNENATSGSVIVTELGGGKVKGTFSFKTAKSTITDGSFDVKL